MKWNASFLSLTMLPLLVAGCAAVTIGGSSNAVSGTARSSQVAAAPAEEFAERERLDIYEAVVRNRLSKWPLARGNELHLFINGEAPQLLIRRFPEYKVTVQRGSPGRSPPPGRWYSIMLGHMTEEGVAITVFGREPGAFLYLAKKKGHWEVVQEYPSIIS